MNGTDWMKNAGGAVRASLKKYRLVWLVICAGLLLLLFPMGRAGDGEGEDGVLLPAETFDLAAAEARMSEALSRIDGAGEVTAVLTVQNGTRRILAENTDRREGGEEHRTETVVLSRGGSTEETVTVQEIYPRYQGALIVCPGGDDPEVRLKLTEGVIALTGLGADKISISKGK